MSTRTHSNLHTVPIGLAMIPVGNVVALVAWAMGMAVAAVWVGGTWAESLSSSNNGLQSDTRH